MGDILRVQFFIENRVGAGGNIGADMVAKSAPDGYTLLMATVSTHAINPGLYAKMPYDPIRDFAPIAQIGVTPTLLGVHPSVPANDIKSLIALTKATPGKYTYGSSGVGSILHLCGEQFKALAGGLNIVHVPYRGSAPTLQEQGLKGFECYTWNAILAPAGTSAPIIMRLTDAIAKALEDSAVFTRLQEVGIDPTPGRGPHETTEFIRAELAKWAPIIKASGAAVN
jgi:tripartite-type tricarboxylate transporter receptor subunit TctC